LETKRQKSKIVLNNKIRKIKKIFKNSITVIPSQIRAYLLKEFDLAQNVARIINVIKTKELLTETQLLRASPKTKILSLIL
jgi:hypothetical protein